LIGEQDGGKGKQMPVHYGCADLRQAAGLRVELGWEGKGRDRDRDRGRTVFHTRRKLWAKVGLKHLKRTLVQKAPIYQ